MEKLLKAIAAKLNHEGVNKDNYSQIKAISVLRYTAMPDRLVSILKQNEKDIVALL